MTDDTRLKQLRTTRIRYAACLTDRSDSRGGRRLRVFLPLLASLLFAAWDASAAAQDAAARPALPSKPPGRVLLVSPGSLKADDPKLQLPDIRAAAKAVEPGDRVVIHAGIYRESVTIARSGTPERPIRFEVEPADYVIVTGADALSQWRKEPDTGKDNIFSVEWPHSFLSAPTHAHPENDRHLLIGRCEQVFVQDYLLHQVLLRSQLARGTFWVDDEGHRLYVWGAGNEDLTRLPVEASARPFIWQCQGDYVQVRGLRFRRAANWAQLPAGVFTGRGDVIEDCVFEDTNGEGAAFNGKDQTVRRCTFQDNGQLGFGAVGAEDLHLNDCLTRNNNTKNFGRGWEAGGDKIVLSRRVVIEHSRFMANRGAGLWFDIGNEDCTVHHCLIADNEGPGIFYEISYGLHAHDNVVAGNGFAGDPGDWGGHAGIVLSSSPECVVERNLLVGNREGFDFRDQLRNTKRIGDKPGDPAQMVWNHDEVIRHNVFAYNHDAQEWGWFDLKDESYLPKAMQTAVGPAAPPTKDKEAASGVRPEPTAAAPPARRSLERLHIQFADNLYAVREGQGLFHWGTLWLPRVFCDNLDEVRDKLQLEQGSVAAPFAMADFLTRDFRLPADSVALKLHAYPEGQVPEARLGVLPPKKAAAE